MKSTDWWNNKIGKFYYSYTLPVLLQGDVGNSALTNFCDLLCLLMAGDRFGAPFSMSPPLHHRF